MNYDVIVIGAGPGGIFSAYELSNLNPELKIAVFESGHSLEKRKCPIDGDKIKIKTSPASAITLHCEGRYGQFKASRTETYTYAEFDYIPEKLGSYFRIEVRDSQGYKAYSNAYFIDDIQKRKDNE